MKVFPKNYGRGQLTPGDAGRFEGKFLAELILIGEDYVIS